MAFQIKVLFRAICLSKNRGCSPFQKLHVLRVLDETRPHHDRLKALSVDGPQLDIC